MGEEKDKTGRVAPGRADGIRGSEGATYAMGGAFAPQEARCLPSFWEPRTLRPADFAAVIPRDHAFDGCIHPVHAN